MLKKPHAEDRKITGQIIYTDRFGNLITNIDEDLIKKVFKSKRFEVMIGSCTIKKLVPSYAYAKKNEIVSLIGSSGFLEIAVRDANADVVLGVKRGDIIILQ
ncbi:MAG: SAM-dependent chlorinase/fluorinase [Deltaproteobacteria bacterium]|nr:SAM-dependent chlorinase/fluorinase [Deltaproteobacteria bacterium]